MLSRMGFAGGAFATTAIIIGGFAVINGNVSLGTLKNSLTGRDGGSGQTRSTLAGGQPGGTSDPDASLTVSASSLPQPTTTSTTASPSVPAARRTSSTSRSVSARPTKPPSATTSSSAPATDSTDLAQQVLAQINAARKSAGVPALTMSTGLVRSAAAHDKVMSGGCGLSHQCPGEADLGKRISAQGVTWTAAGENIGQGGPEPATGEAIVSMAKQLTADMLAETPPNDGHRKNILSTSFKHVGIALYRDSKGTVWMTQDFLS